MSRMSDAINAMIQSAISSLKRLELSELTSFGRDKLTIRHASGGTIQFKNDGKVYYNGTEIGTGSSGETGSGTYLPLAGGTMTGTIVMGGNRITGLPSTPTLTSDAISLAYGNSSYLRQGGSAVSDFSMDGNNLKDLGYASFTTSTSTDLIREWSGYLTYFASSRHHFRVGDSGIIYITSNGIDMNDERIDNIQTINMSDGSAIQDTSLGINNTSAKHSFVTSGDMGTKLVIEQTGITASTDIHVDGNNITGINGLSGTSSLYLVSSSGNPIILSPGLTGDSETQLRGDTRFMHDASYGVALTSPTMTSNITFTLPDSDGSDGDVLTTDGSGNLSFEAPSWMVDVVDDTTPQLGGDLDCCGNNITGINGLSGTSSLYLVSSSGNPIILSPGLTGDSETQLRGDTRFMHDASYGVALTSPTMTSNITFTLPNADGDNGHVLTTDGSGNLSFEAPTSGMVDIVDDTTPQLGGDLDVNGNKIVAVSNGDIELQVQGTGVIKLTRTT